MYRRPGRRRPRLPPAPGLHAPHMYRLYTYEQIKYMILYVYYIQIG